MTMGFIPMSEKLAGVMPPDGLRIDGIDVTSLLQGGAGVHVLLSHGHLAESWAVRKRPWKPVGRDEIPRALVKSVNDVGEKQNHFNDQPEASANE
jgi:hypothetical protein